MPGHRCDCLYCRKSILSRDRGTHYLKHHKEEIFASPSNLKALHSRNYEKSPLFLRLGDAQKTYTFCLSDSSCFSRSDLAKQHLKTNLDGHLTALKKLREEFPKTWTPQEETENPLTEEERQILQRWFLLAISSDTVGTTRKEVALFKKLGFNTDKEELKQLFPDIFKTSREDMEERFAPENANKIPPSSPPEQDEKPKEEEPAPTVIEEPIKEEPIPPPKEEPKPPAKRDARLDLMYSLLEDSGIDEPSKNKIRKDLGLPLVEIKTPPPPPSAPPPPSEFEEFQKLSPWQKLLKANPGLPMAEMISYAKSQNIQIESSHKIISDTKVKRIAKPLYC